MTLCSHESEIGFRNTMITCSDPDSNSGTFSAIVEGSNAAMIVANILQQSDDFTVTLSNGLSITLTPCSGAICTMQTMQIGKEGQNSGLVAGVVISVIFLVAMVIAAAVLVTMIIFKYR
jgi:hypothetical protein